LVSQPCVDRLALDQVPTVATEILENRDDAIGVMPWLLNEPHAGCDHGRMIAIEIIRLREQEDPSPGLVTMRATWAGPSARANSRPELAPPGGRTTTQRLPPPSGVSSQSAKSRAR
jgi:hypothetical protein